MNYQRILSVVAIGLLGSYAFSQGEAPKVQVTLPQKTRVGKPVQAVVSVTFANGLHAYQNPPTKDYMIPVSVTVTTKGVSLKSVAYPKGKPDKVGGEDKPVKVYEGSIRIPLTVVIKKPGQLKIGFTVHYQQCNAQACFPPGDVNASASTLVGK